ncbi:MAG TPA: DUF1003 domain-containing protein [Ktedonobacteraceae bacterium]|jgi:uncharacterized membrane protein|nr:DUF1003 domain-containing protein [Ktedonobacteraceae bacterium]
MINETKQQSNPHSNRIKDAQKATELVDIVGENIESIVDLHMCAEKQVSHHQRFIETVTNNLGRPRFFYLIVLFVALWIGVNLLLPRFGVASFDVPPFYWLQGIVSLSALLMTTVILITQNRHGKLDDLHMHLNMQVNLLIERKVTKLIDLVEELRSDMPIVENRHDPQAEAMKEPVNPHEVVRNLRQTLQEVADEGQ